MKFQIGFTGSRRRWIQMCEGMVVCLPPGAGKTRRVWEHILKGASKKTYVWRRRISNTFILTPNRHVHDIWISELAELAYRRHMLTLPAGKEPKLLKIGTLKRRLRNQLSLPRLGTFRRLRSPRSRKCRYLILDEWHRLPHEVIQKCINWNEVVHIKGNKRRSRGWFLAGNYVKERIYFVSATPINPVLEDEILGDRVIDRPLDDEECRAKVKEAIFRAACVVSAFTGITRRMRDDKLFSYLRNIGVACMEAGSNYRHGLHWTYPSPLDSDARSQVRVTDEILVQFLRGFLRQKAAKPAPEAGSAWLEEYAWATGLVRTCRRNRKYYLSPGPNYAAGKSFGIPYKRLYVDSHSSRRAENWLYKEHPRIRYLFEALKMRRLVREAGNGKYEWQGKQKAVIFCVHQAVALGLVSVLQNYISTINESKLPIAIETNVRGRNVDELRDEFNAEDSQTRILVATDALSESIDLHQCCKTLIHYELPWSPLRLLQRVGRLTRIKQSAAGRIAFNKGVRVAHVIIPGSVEEERINRLVRRIKLLDEQKLWPLAASWKEVSRGLLGSGPSQHLAWLLGRGKGIQSRAQ